MVKDSLKEHLLLSKQIRQYLTHDMSVVEKLSYLNYINGDVNSIQWIEKGLNRREYLLLSNLSCDICNSYISVRENGLSKCSNGHYCTEQVLNFIL